MSEKIVHSNATCPKCKSNRLFLIEVWDGATITWEQIDGKFDRNDGSLEPGNPVRVEGNCYECDHRWTFRNTPQIDNVITTEHTKTS